MQIVETKTGKTFPITWCGIDGNGALRFELQNVNVVEAFNVFSKSSETQTLIHMFDEHKTEYNGYTNMKAMNVAQSGNIVIALTKGAVTA